MTTDQHDWLQQRHAGWVTPREVMDDAVRRASGSPAATFQRIIEGEINETWDVTTTDSSRLIVRIAHREHPGFGREQWAAQRCRDAGVPAPEVLLVDEQVIDDETIGIWVSRRIDGEPISQQADAAELTRAAGEILARIHSVPSRGFGWLQDDLHGPHETFEEATADWRYVERDHTLAAGVPPRDLDDAAAIVDLYRPSLRNVRPRLVHGDFTPGHVLGAHGRIVGVIDFGNVQSGHPAVDVAWWDVFCDQPGHPTSLLLEGYRRVSPLDAEFEVLRRLCRLPMTMGLMTYFTETQRPGAVAFARSRFDDALAWLRANA